MPLPINRHEWDKEVQKWNLTQESLFTLTEVASASKITRPQFLMLRVLYKKVHTVSQLLELFTSGKVVSQETWLKATEHLRTSASFREYLKCITDAADSKGTFQMARLYQRRCSQLKSLDSVSSPPKVGASVTNRVTRSQTARMKQNSPSRDPQKKTGVDFKELNFFMNVPNLPETPVKALPLPGQSGEVLTGSDSRDDWDDDDDDDRDNIFSGFTVHGSPFNNTLVDGHFRVIEDEQIVNFALSLLLDTLVADCPDVKGSWSPYRAPFKVQDSSTEVYEARVDGVYRLKDSEIKMIVEVKSNSRAKGGVAVDMQESAQMAAWIASPPGKILNFGKKIAEDTPNKDEHTNEENEEEEDKQKGDNDEEKKTEFDNEKEDEDNKDDECDDVDEDDEDDEEEDGKEEKEVGEEEEEVEVQQKGNKEQKKENEGDKENEGEEDEDEGEEVEENEEDEEVEDGEEEEDEEKEDDEEKEEEDVEGGEDNNAHEEGGICKKNTEEVVKQPLKPPSHRRALISQNRRDVWVTFATYPDEYVEYIRGEDPEVTDALFMVMKRYGPFDITDVDSMKYFCCALLALSLQEGVLDEKFKDN